MDISRIKELIAKREEIDRELVTLVTGGTSGTVKKPIVCSICNETGHTARTCEKKHPASLEAEADVKPNGFTGQRGY